jgi:hypothetical protein
LICDAVTTVSLSLKGVDDLREGGLGFGGAVVGSQTEILDTSDDVATARSAYQSAA